MFTLPGNQQNLQFLNKNTVSFYESQEESESGFSGGLRRNWLAGVATARKLFYLHQLHLSAMLLDLVLFNGGIRQNPIGQ
jgi:hypothetical protein